MVVEGSGEACTLNLCQQCCNEKLVQQGKQPLIFWQWKGVVERKAHRGRLWEVLGELTTSGRNVRVFHSCKGGSKDNSSGRCSGKTRRTARSVASGVPIRKKVLEQIKTSADTNRVSNAAGTRCKTCEKMATGENWMNNYNMTTMKIG